MKSSLGVWTIAMTVVFASTGCKNTAEGVKRDVEENRKQAAPAIERAREGSEKAAEKATDAASRAADATAKAVGTVGSATRAAIETMDVKAALIADKRIDASGIDVDTDATTNTVVLKGHVPNNQQKTIAGEIAAGKANGYTVKNELTVKSVGSR